MSPYRYHLRLWPPHYVWTVRMVVEVHFTDQSQASVFIDSGTTVDSEPFGELLLSTLFSARSLVSFGSSSPSAISLANHLREIGPRLLEFAYDSPTDGPRLVPHEGEKGRKGFRATLRADGEAIDFKLKPWGLGIFSRDADFYVPHATLTLLRYLTLRRRSDGAYVTALGLCQEVLAGGVLSGTVDRRNQVAASVAAAHMGLDVLEDSTRTGPPIAGFADDLPVAYQLLEELAEAKEMLHDILARHGYSRADEDLIESFGRRLRLCGKLFESQHTIVAPSLRMVEVAYNRLFDALINRPNLSGTVVDLLTQMGSDLDLLRSEMSDPHSRTNQFDYDTDW